MNPCFNQPQRKYASNSSRTNPVTYHLDRLGYLEERLGVLLDDAIEHCVLGAMAPMA